jgi:hypothetical protein
MNQIHHQLNSSRLHLLPRRGTRAATTHATTGGADDHRHDFVRIAQADHARGSAPHLSQHRADLSRRAGPVPEDLRVSPDGVTAGGIYLWNSKAEAEAMYTEAWRAFVREKYRTDPTVTYFESPMVVDNVVQQILTDP